MEVDEAIARLATPFVEEELFEAALGGGKRDKAAVRLYLDLPAGGRPDLSPYFDRDWYLRRYPDVAASGADPLLHFLGWGLLEGRAPHPLIDLAFMCAADPQVVPAELSAGLLRDVLDGDRVDPGPLFERTFYRGQVGPDAIGGLLRHFLTRGLFDGLRPAPDIDPVAAYRRADGMAADIREGLRSLALARRPDRAAAAASIAELPPESDAKLLFQAESRAGLAACARNPLDFRTGDASPSLSVVMVAHDRFDLTLSALASLRAGFAGAIELVLIDSGSTDETQYVTRYVRGAHVLRFAENVGFLRGSNAGIQLACASAVLLLNNDVRLAPGAVEAALARLDSDPGIGAVGARIVRSHGLLQEAGSIVWRNGETLGYCRDASPLVPDANFVRDVDFASAAFLLLRLSTLEEAGGFDEAFLPAYYEDADLCLRIAAGGLRVVYDPSVLVWHMEYGSSSGEAAAAQIAGRRSAFVAKNRAQLRERLVPDARAPLFARNARRQRGRVLFLDDHIPLRRLGQGFVRSNDLVRALAALDYHVTVFPVQRGGAAITAVHADMPDAAEVMHDASVDALEAFLKARRGYYDTLWICRTHNLDRVRPILERCGTDVLADLRIILDTEAIVSLREAERRRVLGLPDEPDLAAALEREFANIWFCQSAVAVSEQEAGLLRGLGYPEITVLGHAREPAPTPKAFSERRGLLFVGAFATPGNPNLDALLWFADEVMPRIARELDDEARLTVAGYVSPEVELGVAGSNPRLTILGQIDDLTQLYDDHRIAVAPARFAAGIPYKVHEAASMGVPVIASRLLASQLGWSDTEIGAADDADAFAREICTLYRDEARWSRMREQALARVAADCSPIAFSQGVRAIMRASAQRVRTERDE